MSQADFQSFTPDDVAAEVNRYSDPPINVTAYKGSL